MSGLIDKLKGKSNISVMADRRVTVHHQLKDIGVDLNIPPFKEGRGKLPASEVLEGRKIASLRIHIERVIGRIKNYTILKGTLPISLSRIANPIVYVCAWLVNFQTVLIPPEFTEKPDDVEIPTTILTLTQIQSLVMMIEWCIIVLCFVYYQNITKVFHVHVSM